MKLLLSSLLIAAVAVSASAQVILSDDFESYADTAAMGANWTLGSGGTLATTGGNPGQAGAHDGSNQAHLWAHAFSVTPTDEMPLILKADIWFSGTNNQRNTVGLRTGANPLYEVGFHNAAGSNGLSLRILNFAGNDGWVELLSYSNLGIDRARWISTTSTFSATALDVVLVDSLAVADGGFGTIVFNSTGATAAGAFTDLRFGGPSALSSAGGGFLVDNISLEVIPEPSTYAMIAGLLALAGALILRRRGS